MKPQASKQGRKKKKKPQLDIYETVRKTKRVPHKPTQEIKSKKPQRLKDALESDLVDY